MSRAIDADALSYRLEKRIDSVTDFSFAEGLSEAIVEIGLSPTLSPDDVRGVGKWIEVAMRIKCSVCGTDFNDEVTCCSDCYRWPWNYCPNCGAKIEEVN